VRKNERGGERENGRERLRRWRDREGVNERQKGREKRLERRRENEKDRALLIVSES